MSLPFAEVSLSAAAWALTYLLHSTLFLGGTWIALRIARDASHRVRDRVWKLAMLAGLATATLQVGLGLEPLGGRFALRNDPELPASSPAAFEESEVEGVERVDGADAPPVVEDCEPARDPGAQPRARPATRSTREQDASFPVHLVHAPSSVELPHRSVPVIEPARPARRRSQLDLVPNGSGDVDRVSVAASTRGRALDRWATSFSIAWALGLVVAAFAFSSAILRLERGLRGRRSLRSGEALRLLADLERRAGLVRSVELTVSDDLTTPVTFGLLRPRICVPSRAIELLPRDQLEAMLAHELGHAVRRDPLWQLVARAIASALFFQPLNRVAAAELADAAEYLSDDWAVAHTGRRLSLAGCLTEVATWIVGARRTLPAPAMTDGKYRLGRRVHRLLEEDERSVEDSPDRFALVCAAVLVSGALVVPGFASSEGAEPRGSTNELEASAPQPELELAILEPVTEGVDSTPDALGHVLESLDREIALLEDEVGALRVAILGLDEPHALLESVQAIANRIAQLRQRRETFALELPRLARFLERPTREQSSH